MNDPFLTACITMQSWRKIVQRAPAVGAKMWCLSLCFLSHAHSPERRAFDGCTVGTSIGLLFIGRFQRGFQHFYQQVAMATCWYYIFLSASVSNKISIFAPIQQKLCVGSINDWHLLELSRRSLSVCRVWGDRSTRAGCRSENWCFCMLRLVFLRVGDIVQTSIVWPFYGSILMRFSALFQNGLFFQTHYVVLIFVTRWGHNFREIAVKKFRKVQKSAARFVCTTSCR